MDVDEDDSFWVTDAERSILAALEEPVEQEGGSGSPSKGTGKGKAKKVASKPASKKTTLEVEVEARFAKAEKTVRRVYARHPNLDHLVVALKEAGVGGIEERIGVSVGTLPSLSLSLLLDGHSCIILDLQVFLSSPCSDPSLVLSPTSTPSSATVPSSPSRSSTGSAVRSTSSSPTSRLPHLLVRTGSKSTRDWSTRESR